ncbi:hypothetical protein BN6_29060 [Saccharothrix espanaensis DSM 44229]|uniref:Uncharacterized protein n=1 Tax=Saccharothrix espanaensis (strain ATCC 51144 / DSM 44229 / JCM 9112 / NBRC 15066 / NRRL 15764) TaxID=1179773 RepID=K0JRG8_SACES|nr:hypothetical protein BN6_29060 [Saccharothrix espanaensis DSM 44229]
MHTNDELLDRFARLHSAVPINEAEGSIPIDFTSPAVQRRVSRGYKQLTTEPDEGQIKQS